jgi:serine protease Do
MKRSLIPLLALLFIGLSGYANSAQLPDFTSLAKQYGPAVVNISTKQNARSSARMHGLNIPDLPEDSPLREFFRHFFNEEGGGVPEEGPSLSLGSGFFISADGYIMTNHHVVSEADEIIVRTSDQRQFKATVVGSDRRSDTALLKVDIADAPVVKLGTARNLEVGEWVLAIGSPFGFDHSVTAGIVSAKGRNLPSENYVPFIQTDVAINPGNSGGPLIDLDGNVVGVNSQIYSRTGGFMGLSFAVPIDLAMNVADQLRTKGHVSRGWLGVMIQDINRDLAESFGMRHPRGALVSRVLPDSPAEQAGVEVGDIIVSYNGHDLKSSSSLPPLVGASPVDRPSTLRVLRNGKERELQVVIGELPEEDSVAQNTQQRQQKISAELGLSVAELNKQQRRELGVNSNLGVMLEKVEAGPGREAGLQRGDVILMMDNKNIASVEQFKNIARKLPKGRSVAVLVQREDDRLFLAMRIPD